MLQNLCANYYIEASEVPIIVYIKIVKRMSHFNEIVSRSQSTWIEIYADLLSYFSLKEPMKPKKQGSRSTTHMEYPHMVSLHSRDIPSHIFTALTYKRIATPAKVSVPQRSDEEIIQFGKAKHDVS